MLVSTRSRYGLKVMYDLALAHGGGPVFLRDIARRHGISEKYLSKLVIPLRGAGLVTSFRGAHGGYSLARDPHAITLREIVHALEGEVAVTGALPPASRGEVHPADAVWATVERAVNESMDRVTLESIVRAGREGVLNYQI